MIKLYCLLIKYYFLLRNSNLHVSHRDRTGHLNGGHLRSLKNGGVLASLSEVNRHPLGAANLLGKSGLLVSTLEILIDNRRGVTRPTGSIH